MVKKNFPPPKPPDLVTFRQIFSDFSKTCHKKSPKIRAAGALLESCRLPVSFPYFGDRNISKKVEKKSEKMGIFVKNSPIFPPFRTLRVSFDCVSV